MLTLTLWLMVVLAFVVTAGAGCSVTNDAVGGITLGALYVLGVMAAYTLGGLH